MAEEKGGGGGGGVAGAAGALVSVAFRAIGAAAAAGDYAKAERFRQLAMQEWNIQLPDLKEIQAEYQADSELNDVRADGRLQGAEFEALGEMRDTAFEGMRPEDLANIERAKFEALNLDSGLRGRNESEQARRGTLGSGADLANQAYAGQAAVDRAYQGNLQTAGDASRRRLGALGAYGSFASQLKQADLQQKNATATAQDRINAFNTEDKRFGRNFNTALPQQQFQNQMGLANKRSGALRQRGDDYMGYGQKTENTYADIGEGIGRSIEELGDTGSGASSIFSMFGM